MGIVKGWCHVLFPKSVVNLNKTLQVEETTLSGLKGNTWQGWDDALKERDVDLSNALSEESWFVS